MTINGKNNTETHIAVAIVTMMAVNVGRESSDFDALTLKSEVNLALIG